MSHRAMRVLAVFGTRPEAIKMAPVIAALQGSSAVECRVCVTAQHRHLLDQVLESFDISPSYDLDLMTPNQRPAAVTAEVLRQLPDVFDHFRPDWVVVHGDTTTTLAATLAAFYQAIPVAHVEAGLRTGNLSAPWPEEMNRVVVDRLATLHFAPTIRARENLLGEGVEAGQVVVTGNTIVDAVHDTVRRLDDESAERDSPVGEGRRIVLVTGHRRENFGHGFQMILEAVAELSNRDDIRIVFSIHPNPNVRRPVMERLSGIDNIELVEPPPYRQFISLLRRSELIISDSGGIQEEAAVLGRPILVTRETTERPEAVESGIAVLVGRDREQIVATAHAILDHGIGPKVAERARSIFGNGTASDMIVETLLHQSLGREL